MAHHRDNLGEPHDEAESEWAANEDDLLSDLREPEATRRLRRGASSLDAFRTSRVEAFRGADFERVSLVGPMGAIAPAVGARSVRQPGRTLPGAVPSTSRDPRLSRPPLRLDLEQRSNEETEVAERTQVVRTGKLPRAAIADDGSVLPTDDVETTPGTFGQIDPNEQTSPGFGSHQPAQMEHVPSERTEVIRQRRIHPDTVDPETGAVWPTDHVPTAPGLAGLSTDPEEPTMIVRRRR
ncbi:MAG: hypothetical protein AAFX94_01765 [Myxococcota bacterium]